MKINFVLPSIGHSGGMDVVYRYAELLTQAGHDILVYREIKASNMYRYKSQIKNFVHQIYCTAKGLIEARKKKNTYDKFVYTLNDRTIRDADAIIATAWPTAYKVNGLSYTKGEKYYFIQDFEIWDNLELVKKSYELPLNKIVISTWINEQLHRSLNIGPFPVIYNGVDTAIYHKVEVKKDPDQISFLMLNHTLPKKGVDKGLQVFESISDKYDNCKLRMFGMCDRSNLPDYVEYYQNPSPQKLVELYSGADIFIFPSLEEGWGLTPLEAMACGCVVVGTRTGFVLDLGIHGNNMMISEPGDCRAMISNISEILEDSAKFNNIKHNGEKMVSFLRWENSVRAFEKILLSHMKDKVYFE